MTTTAAPATQRRRRKGVPLFLRQVMAELKKVVRPTRNELLTYTSVVLVFVLAVMVFVSGLDYGFGQLVLQGRLNDLLPELDGPVGEVRWGEAPQAVTRREKSAPGK